jgi:hypothetical protein
MSRILAAASLAALLLGGCAPNVPRLTSPNRVDSFCPEDRVAKATAIESIVTSTGDKAEAFPVPSAAEIANIVKSTGGVIGHWDAQQLYSPAVAQSLGVSGPYLQLTDAAISNRLSGVDSRRVYLTFKLPDGSSKTLPFRAYDMQDVCNDGKLSG